ncbi:MAG: bifunctional 3-hydroxydecanoyl-ACP dehydratase/trans-2-decenoyl-ACP isomerase, partial [Alphaproteobacteria bacterium]
RITQISSEGGSYGRGEVIAELDINPDLWFYPCHFEGDPVMPGCLGVDALWQLVGFYIGWLGGEGKGRALGAGDIKFTGQVRPTVKTVTYKISIRRAKVSAASIAFADGLVYADDRLVYDCKGLRVGLFNATSLEALD